MGVLVAATLWALTRNPRAADLFGLDVAVAFVGLALLPLLLRAPA